MKIIATLSSGFLIMAGISYWIEGAINWWAFCIIGGGLGAFMSVVVGIANADKTPLRKYELVREISSLVCKLLEKGSPPT